jgi:hypothetical protein
LPFLRGTTSRHQYRAVTGTRDKSPIPNRDPAAHRSHLLGQLDALLLQARTRAPRDPEATREIIAVRPLSPETPLLPEQLSDKSGDVRIVGVVPETGVVLLDAAGPELAKLREKAATFGEPKTRTYADGRVTTSLAHQRALAPVEDIGIAVPRDWEGMRLSAALSAKELDLEQPSWFEVACRGGYRNPLQDTTNSRAQVQRQLFHLGHSVAHEFVAPEEITFFVRLSLNQLRALVANVDCIFGYDLAPVDILTWRLLSDPPARNELESFDLAPPPEDAPAVAILDSGISLEHPLLKAALLRASSILPGIDSAADAHGHGTKMAGATLYAGELAESLTRREHHAGHWIQSVRVLVRPREGTASEANREYWPKFTSDAITEAEKVDARTRPRVFVLAVTYPINPLTPSTYSQAVDQLAFHDGNGRLMIVSAGNVAPEDLYEASTTYPGGVLLRKIHEPAQGSNVLTVGAYTDKTRLPPEAAFAEAKSVAPAGGLSPHTTSGRVDAPWPIKPELVLEGGNVALGTSIADPGADTLVTLTTGLDVLRNPLAQINATSEASARAAHMAASIWRQNPSFRSETVRGLLVHSASWTAAMREQFSFPDRLYACGYGVPDPECARSCADDRATVIIEDEMPNLLALEKRKIKQPKRSTTPMVEEVDARWMKVFRLPLPDDKLLANPDAPVQLRVTLSYLPEPSTFRTRVEYGLKLKWDMQGPRESEAEFFERIDDLHRPRGADGKRVKKDYKESFDWEIGIQRRSRGTVQSDRWSGKASLLAGTKLISVFPVLGWWDRRVDMKNRTQPFSLIVSVFADDIYFDIEAALQLPVAIEVG